MSVIEEVLDTRNHESKWLVLIQENKRPNLENPRWICKRWAKQIISQQVKRGHQEPKYHINKLGPRCAWGNPNDPSKIFRIVHYQGFAEPGYIPEAEVREWANRGVVK